MNFEPVYTFSQQFGWLLFLARLGESASTAATAFFFGFRLCFCPGCCCAAFVMQIKCRHMYEVDTLAYIWTKKLKYCHSQSVVNREKNIATELDDQSS